MIAGPIRQHTREIRLAKSGWVSYESITAAANTWSTPHIMNTGSRARRRANALADLGAHGIINIGWDKRYDVYYRLSTH